MLAQGPRGEAKEPPQVRPSENCQPHVRNIRVGQGGGVNGQSAKATRSERVLDYTFRHRRLKRECTPFLP